MKLRGTILGASGFIGSLLLRELERQGWDCFVPERDDARVFSESLGHVFYCIGTGGEFRKDLFRTFQANVGYLAEILKKSNFQSLLYLSSARLYRDCESGEETQSIPLQPNDIDRYYDACKLMGEALCLSLPEKRAKVLRLSNVVGEHFRSENFLYRILREAIEKGRVTLEASLESERDYIAVEDVLRLLPKIATEGKKNLYNLASGMNLNHRDLLTALQKKIPFVVDCLPGAVRVYFPKISILRLRDEFGFNPSPPLQAIETLVERWPR